MFKPVTTFKVICFNDHNEYVWASRSKSWTNRAEAQHYANTCAQSRNPRVIGVLQMGDK